MSLALALALRPAAPLAPEPVVRPALTLVAPPAAGQETLALDFDPPATPPAPDELAPASVVAAVCVAALEVIDGLRSPLTLTRAVSPEVLALVGRRAATRRARAVPGRVRHRVTVRAVRRSSPAHGVCEAAVVVVQGERCRAVAMRLEVVGDRWVLQELQLG